MSQYTTQEQIEAYLQRELTEDEAVNIEAVIVAVSDFIKNYLNRNWNDVDGTDPASEQRLYDGNGKDELFIDDFKTISALQFLDWEGDIYDSLLATDYLLYPLNSVPKNSIRLRSRRFPQGKANVRITGVFTSGDVPQQVQIVAAQLVGAFLEEAKTQGGLKSEQIEGYAYELATSTELDEKRRKALSLLDSLRKIEF